MMQESAAIAGTVTPVHTGHACRHNHDFHQEQAAKPACKCQRLFWPRRIHALVGLWLGLFLAMHLGICVTGLNPANYQHNVDRIDALVAIIPAISLLAVFLPFAFQAGSGLFLLKKEGVKYNVQKCNRGGKLRFFTQRMSGLVILAFVVLHVATLHQWGLHLLYRLTRWSAFSRYESGGLFVSHNAAFSSTVSGLSLTFSGLFPKLLILLFTLVAIWAAAFHIGNGFWSGGIIWKVPGAKMSNPNWGRLCVAVEIALAVLGTIAWWAFTVNAPARELAVSCMRMIASR